MGTMLEMLIVLPSAMMVAIGAVRAVLEGPAEWRTADGEVARAARRRLVLVHDSAREKLLRLPATRPSRAANGKLRLVYHAH